MNNSNESKSRFREDDNLPSINSQIENKANKDDKLVEERITFNSKRLSGTINLIGATMDDLSLKDYFETIIKKTNKNSQSGKFTHHIF